MLSPVPGSDATVAAQAAVTTVSAGSTTGLWPAAWPSWRAVTFDATGHLDGQHPKVSHQLAGTVEAVDVQDKRRQHRRRDRADAGDGVEVVGLGQPAIRRNQVLL